MTERLDAMLTSALAPTQIPTEECRRVIHRYAIENGRTVETRSFQRERKMTAVSMLATVTVIISAAILVLAVPVCAIKIYNFLHRDNVEHYISGADEVSRKAPDVIQNLVTENGDYRVTLDALYSDGHSAMIILTTEAISENGQKHFHKTADGIFMPSFCIKYANGSDGPSHHVTNPDIDYPIIGGGYVYEYMEEARARDDVRSAYVVNCRDIDLSKDVKLELFANENSLLDMQYFFNRDPILAKRFPDDSAKPIINYLEGMEFTVNFAPNVTCNALHDADGRQIFLSAFEIYSDDLTINPARCDVMFLKDSGERIRFDTKNDRVHGQDNRCIVFGEFIDPDEYIGVEVNGVEFWK